eukprot:gene38250-46482_t
MALLLIIDPQVDFHEGGALAVPGATADTSRIADLIRNHVGAIDSVVVTLDSHHREHIAHALFWQDANGDWPPVFQRITHQDVVDGRWLPRDSVFLEHCLSYTKALEEKNRFTLTIWPAHCIIGSPGHAVHPVLQEALGLWSAENGKEVQYVMKGMNNLTEMYSVLQAEVPLADDPRTQLNTQLLSSLRAARKVVVAGQALSHCVNYSVRDLVQHWAPRESSDI